MATYYADTVKNGEDGRLSDKLANRKAKSLLAKAFDLLIVAKVETLCNK